jgi:fructokinase
MESRFGIVKRMEEKLYGGIEAGGTKFICAVGSGDGTIVSRTEIPTTDVAQTLQAVVDFFKQNSAIVSLGIGSFGPIDLNPSSSQFGFITHTPKAGWENTDIKGSLEKSLGVSAVLETDVNCAGIGEKFFGAAQAAHNFVYITVGTGIGGGLIIDGVPYHGAAHLEVGHMRVPHKPLPDGFSGTCSFHKDCLEGLASGPAMEARWGIKPQDIVAPEAWELEAQYIGSALNNLVMSLRPELFVIGGGVMNRDGLIEAIREQLQVDINGYLDMPSLESYVVPASSPDNAVLGAIKLAATTLA